MILKKTGFFIITALAVLPLALLVGLLAEILVQIVSSLLFVVFGLFLLYLFALTAKNGRRG